MGAKPTTNRGSEGRWALTLLPSRSRHVSQAPPSKLCALVHAPLPTILQVLRVCTEVLGMLGRVGAARVQEVPLVTIILTMPMTTRCWRLCGPLRPRQPAPTRATSACSGSWRPCTSCQSPWCVLHMHPYPTDGAVDKFVSLGVVPVCSTPPPSPAHPPPPASSYIGVKSGLLWLFAAPECDASLCWLAAPSTYHRPNILTQSMSCRCVRDNLYEWEVVMFGFSSSDPAERGLAGDLARLRKVRAVASRPASCRVTVCLLHIVLVSLGSNMVGHTCRRGSPCECTSSPPFPRRLPSFG